MSLKEDSMKINSQRFWPKSRALGFSLVELMIAMTLGLILLAGVGVIFISTQQSGQSKRALDNAQEALRYSSYSISRLTRIGTIDRINSSDTNLRISLNRGAATPDCLGNTATEINVQVVFSHDAANNELVCTVGANSGVIARGITTVEFRYEVFDGQAWTATTAVDAVSVRTRLVMDNIAEARFVATSRAQVFAAVSEL